MLEDKYTKPPADYIASRIWKSITGIFYTYPEFRFILKIFIGLFVAIILFLLLRRFT